MLICPHCHQSLFVTNGSCWDHGGELKPGRQTVLDEVDPDPSLPRFGSIDELTTTGLAKQLKQKFWIVAVLVLVVFLAREGGFVNLNLTRYELNSNVHTELAGYLHRETATSITTNHNNKEINTTYTAKGSDYGLKVRPRGEPSWTIDLREEIQKHLSNVGQNTAIAAR